RASEDCLKELMSGVAQALNNVRIKINDKSRIKGSFPLTI
ncbi:MAG: hypothetical protein ACI823_002864, partial [Chitinophagales bacterium]